MKKEDCRLVNITENIQIPVPKDCTAEEAQALVASFKANNDVNELEKEVQDLARAIKEGKLISADEVTRELEKTETARLTA